MMVTFVSQCEKKALKRTRRVLDAFANRIGDNTWQTVITQEGLLAVKKLLRKTASKNTAVSCHWIRSRSRSELVWVVGNRGKFNVEGVVPVSFTSKEVPMDITRDKPTKGVDYANTHLQKLDQHLFAVGYVAQQLYSHYYPDDPIRANALFVAGCLHDIGKVDPKFQEWATKEKNKSYVAEDGHHIDETKFSFENHPRHNEISLALYSLLDDISLKSVNGENKKRIKHAIYWHHAKPFRAKGGFNAIGEIYNTLNKSLKNEAWKLVVERGIELLNKVAMLDTKYRDIEKSELSRCFVVTVDPEKICYVEGLQVPGYKEYSSSEQISDFKNQADSNSVNNQLRACLITADRWISSLSAKDLGSIIKHRNFDDFLNQKMEQSGLTVETTLESLITDCLNGFPDDERSQKQSFVAQKLAENYDHVGVLAGAAGCGKTKIALEWAKLRGAKQILWICPRVQICQGLFADLSNSDQPYLPSANVELHTGEFKCLNTYSNETDEADYFSGDIVITTIDQLLNSIISHTKADRLLNYLSAQVVFDEYHEYINMPAFNLLFAELVASRDGLSGGCNALLVSATPHYLYLNEILGLDKQYDVVEMPSFNPCKYQFTFLSYDETKEDGNNPLYQQQTGGSTFVISNTAITAQKSFIRNQNSENAVLLHSKYKKSDKKTLFSEVFEAFQRDGTQIYDVLRSGPIVQASLNISCKEMVSEITSAENNLQRLGRLDRFGENADGINHYIVAVPDTLDAGNRQGSVARFMSSTNVLSSALEWHSFLVEATGHGEKQLTLKELYALYREFYEYPPALKMLEQDLVSAMRKSTEVIVAKASEPKVVIKPKRGQKQRARISKNSLRGDSRFVQMAVCDVSGFPAVSFLDTYAYEIPTSESDHIDSLTASCDSIQGYGDGNKNLLDFMHRKHHSIKGGKKSYKNFVLLNEATDPEYPVFLSYTPGDLTPIGGDRSRHSEAIYYGVCEKQPIGAISIKQLTNQKD